jgi:hypothetical protein
MLQVSLVMAKSGQWGAIHPTSAAGAVLRSDQPFASASSASASGSQNAMPISRSIAPAV